jgi:hypothetical protein
MINKQMATILLLVFSTTVLLAQQKYTVSGTIKDKKNGETMIGVNVFPLELSDVGTSCNEYGFYSLTLPEGKYHIICSYVSYKPDTAIINLNTNIRSDRFLNENTVTTKEVVVFAKKENDNLTNTEISVEKVDMKETVKLPVIFGEKDVLKTIQLLPGVKSAGEGNSGFFVRGGSADQNLILLDEATVYNASHLLGFFSTFNSDALKDVAIIKGNSPAQYGGRLSSVLDVKMKEGNNQDYSVSGGLGLISSRLSLEGPIEKDKGSFIVTGRRTYVDVFLKLTDDYKDNTLYFYDFNAKANYNINDKNRIFISGYFGRDKMGLGSFGIDWGNQTGTLRWNSIITPTLFSNTSIIYNDYSYKGSITSGEATLSIESEIKDYTLKQEFQYYPNTKNTIRFGFNSTYHTLIPKRFKGNAYDEPGKNARYSWDNAIFANNTMEISKELTLDYGLRFSAYSILGGDTYNVYDKGILIDRLALASGKFGKTYYNFEPRFQFNILLNEKSSIKGGYARNTQHMHLLSNSSGSTPTDQWIGNSYNVKPEISDQVSLGYFRNYGEEDNTYQLSVEAYYKNLLNQVDYKNGADISSAPDIESELLYGKGRAYGIEFLLKKTQGRLTGWIGYTLSKTERMIDGINNGNWFNANQDRTHDLSIVAMYQLTERWSLSALFVYNTGNAATFPSGKYNIGGNTVFYYTERNGYRMPDYHRLDFGATYNISPNSSLNFSLFNVYGRENAYSIKFEDGPIGTRAVQTSLFRWVPSITYNFKF